MKFGARAVAVLFIYSAGVPAMALTPPPTFTATQTTPAGSDYLVADTLMSCDVVKVNLYMTDGTPTFDGAGILNGPNRTFINSVMTGNGPNPVTKVENTIADMLTQYKAPAVINYQYVGYITRQCTNVLFIIPSPDKNTTYAYQLS